MRLAACILLLSTAALADKLDPAEATEAAKQRGLKRTIIMAEPFTCPPVAPSKADVAKFRDTSDLAPFALAIDGFLREDFGVPEAIAMFGEHVLCGRFISTYTNYELAPRAKGLHAVALELYDDTLIRIEIELARPIAIDIDKLATKYGLFRKVPDIHRANEGISIAVTNAAFHGSLMLRTDPRDPTKFRSVIYRRTPAIEILPAKFQTAADVARLVKLTVRPRAPEPVRFFGTLGVFDKAHSTGTRDALSPAIAMRNVATAWIEHVALGERRAVQKIDVTFAKPITGDLAKAVGAKAKPGATIDVPGGTVEFDGLHLVITRR
jgi:hypothetical protein